MFLNIHSQSSSKLHGFASLQELVLNGNEVERGILRGGDVFAHKSTENLLQISLTLASSLKYRFCAVELSSFQ